MLRRVGQGWYTHQPGRSYVPPPPACQALSYLDEDFMMQLENFYLDRAMAVKTNIHLNMAACQLKTHDYHTCIYNCTEVRVLCVCVWGGGAHDYHTCIYSCTEVCACVVWVCVWAAQDKKTSSHLQLHSGGRGGGALAELPHTAEQAGTSHSYSQLPRSRLFRSSSTFSISLPSHNLRLPFLSHPHTAPTPPCTHHHVLEQQRLPAPSPPPGAQP